MIDSEIYKDALFKSSTAFAVHEAVFDNQGNMIDYVFLDVNPSFEESTGLEAKRVIGKRFLKEVAKNKEEALRWVKIYEKILKSKKEKIIEQYSAEFHNQYFIHAYPLDKIRFITLFKNTSNEFKMEQITSYFLDHVGKKIDYPLLAQMGLDFSGADYALFNLYEEKGDSFATKAFVGAGDKLDSLLKHIGGRIVGRKWKRYINVDAPTNHIGIIDFEELAPIVGSSIPLHILKDVGEKFNLGKVVLAEITTNKKILGSFTFIFTNENRFFNSSYLNIYLKQLGVFIEKCQLQQSLNLQKIETEIMERKLKKDTLTNAYNRSVINSLLTDRLIIANKNKIKSYFVVLDLDNFKFINDTHGHQVGDAVLRQFVEKIDQLLRSDDLLVRIGGDEFLLYLHSVEHDDDANHIMQRIFESLSAVYHVSDDEGNTLKLNVSLSAGLARFPQDGTNVKELMNKADYTMYKVKKTGKNDFAFFALDKASMF